MSASEILTGVFDDNTIDQDLEKKFPEYFNDMKKVTINQYGHGQINLADNIQTVTNSPNFSKEQFEQFITILKLPEAQIREVQQIYKEADEYGLNERKTKELLVLLDKNLEEIKTILPAPVINQINEVKKLQTSMSFDGKFKASIPIIPFILNYELEAKSNLKDIFKQIWEDMKNGDILLKRE